MQDTRRIWGRIYEAGNPTSNPKDIEVFQKVKEIKLKTLSWWPLEAPSLL